MTGVWSPEEQFKVTGVWSPEEQFKVTGVWGPEEKCVDYIKAETCCTPQKARRVKR